MPVESVSMCVTPVWVHHVKNPNLRIATYALLGSCSQGLFVQKNLLHQLSIIGTQTSITIKTLHWKKTKGVLQSMELLYQESVGINVSLPRTFSRMQIPVKLNEIPTQGDVRRWRHIDKINHLIPSKEETMSVKLLICVNCPKALEPQDVIHHIGGPYIVRGEGSLHSLQ